MTIENIDRVFEPGSLAVIGASNRPGSAGAAVMHNLLSRGFKAAIYPVNPGHAAVSKINVLGGRRTV